MAVNGCGDQGGTLALGGRSVVLDPWGTVLAECADGEGVAVAEIDPARVRAIREQLPSLRHRRL